MNDNQLRQLAEHREQEWSRAHAEGRFGLDLVHLTAVNTFRALGLTAAAPELADRLRPRIYIGHGGEVLVRASDSSPVYTHGALALLRACRQMKDDVDEAGRALQPRSVEEIAARQKASGLYG